MSAVLAKIKKTNTMVVVKKMTKIPSNKVAFLHEVNILG